MYISKHKGKSILVAFALLCSLGYFVLVAFQGATVYYFTVSEMKMQPASEDGKLVRVSGKLVPDSFSRDDGATLAYFSITDGENVMDARHDGILPDLFFNEHSEIVLEGVHIPGHAFASQNVIVKCPSKYVAASDEDQQSY